MPLAMLTACFGFGSGSRSAILELFLQEVEGPMPSVYLLVRDRVEQSRAMLSGEDLFDAELDRNFSLLLERLQVLDAITVEALARAPFTESGKKIVTLKPCSCISSGTPPSTGE